MCFNFLKTIDLTKGVLTWLVKSLCMQNNREEIWSNKLLQILQSLLDNEGSQYILNWNPIGYKCVNLLSYILEVGEVSSCG